MRVEKEKKKKKKLAPMKKKTAARVKLLSPEEKAKALVAEQKAGVESRVFEHTTNEADFAISFKKSSRKVRVTRKEKKPKFELITTSDPNVLDPELSDLFQVSAKSFLISNGPFKDSQGCVLEGMFLVESRVVAGWFRNVGRLSVRRDVLCSLENSPREALVKAFKDSLYSTVAIGKYVVSATVGNFCRKTYKFLQESKTNFLNGLRGK